VTTEDQQWRSSKRNPLVEDSDHLQESWCRGRRMKGQPLSQGVQRRWKMTEPVREPLCPLCTWSSPPLPLWHGLDEEAMSDCMAVNVAEGPDHLPSQTNYISLGPS